MRKFWNVLDAVVPLVMFIVCALLVFSVDGIAPDGTPRWGELVLALLLAIALITFRILDEITDQDVGPCDDCDCEDCGEKTDGYGREVPPVPDDFVILPHTWDNEDLEEELKR